MDVAYVASLASLRLTDEEVKRFSADLANVLDYVNQLQKYDVDKVEPMYHPLPAWDVMREDNPEQGLAVEVALSNAPRQSASQILVPKVVESA